MRVKKSTEPRDSEGASDQKQDPLERRRLQNRLSQRNHRRKIRDRIAKLQERVIANELRAAAALNGWDQPYAPPPLLGSRNLFQQDSGPGNGGADTSSSMTEPFLSFSSSYGLSMTSPWPIAAAQSSTLLSEDSTWLWNIGSSPMDTTYSNSTLCDLMSDATNPSSLGSGEEQPIPDLSSTWSPPHSSASFATPANQPLYYAVNETALPQILQVLSTASPQSKIIVLVPPDIVSTGMESTATSSLLENCGLQDFSHQMGVAPSKMCQCQSQSMAPGLPASMGSRAWANPTPSYLNGCPSKFSNAIGGGLSNLPSTH